MRRIHGAPPIHGKAARGSPGADLNGDWIASSAWSRPPRCLDDPRVPIFNQNRHLQRSRSGQPPFLGADVDMPAAQAPDRIAAPDHTRAQRVNRAQARPISYHGVPPHVPADPGPDTVDQDAFRDTYNAVNERRCPYEKSILTGNCACSRAKRFCIAEREGVHCTADDAQARCLELLEHLRTQARFALRTTDGGSALPHAKAMRIQVGGLRGVRAALDQARPTDQASGQPIDDVDGLLQTAIARFGGLAELPFGQIIQQIAAYRGRQSFRERRNARKQHRDDDEPA